MAKTIADLLSSANHEWDHWGQSTWDVAADRKHIGHRDDEKEFAEYVIESYNSVGGGAPSIADIQNDVYPWSAVGMSAIFKNAGFTRKEFPFAQAHSVWIRAFVKARKTGAPALYHAFRLNEAEASPDVGDLIGYVRVSGTNFEKAQTFYDKITGYPSHSDIVVARRPGEIDVIGANVLDSVTKKTISLSPGGLVSDRVHHWFVVMRRTDF
jgi:hypothetical protein